MRQWPAVGLVLAVLWLFVRGVALEPATVLGELIIGLVIGLSLAFATRGLYARTFDLGQSVRVVPTAVHYVLLFVYEIVVSGLDMAYRVLHPSLPIEPDVVEVPLRVQTDLGITSIANSISLTPGTLTMDYDRETNTLYLHGVAGRKRDATVAPIRRWEDLLLVIFDEELEPEDEPPEQPRRKAPAVRVAGSSPSEQGGEDDDS